LSVLLHIVIGPRDNFSEFLKFSVRGKGVERGKQLSFLLQILKITASILAECFYVSDSRQRERGEGRRYLISNLQMTCIIMPFYASTIELFKNNIGPSLDATKWELSLGTWPNL